MSMKPLQWFFLCLLWSAAMGQLENLRRSLDKDQQALLTLPPPPPQNHPLQPEQTPLPGPLQQPQQGDDLPRTGSFEKPNRFQLKRSSSQESPQDLPQQQDLSSQPVSPQQPPLLSPQIQPDQSDFLPPDGQSQQPPLTSREAQPPQPVQPPQAGSQQQEPQLPPLGVPPLPPPQNSPSPTLQNSPKDSFSKPQQFPSPGPQLTSEEQQYFFPSLPFPTSNEPSQSKPTMLNLRKGNPSLANEAPWLKPGPDYSKFDNKKFGQQHEDDINAEDSSETEDWPEVSYEGGNSNGNHFRGSDQTENDYEAEDVRKQSQFGRHEQSYEDGMDDVSGNLDQDDGDEGEMDNDLNPSWNQFNFGTPDETDDDDETDEECENRRKQNSFRRRSDQSDDGEWQGGDQDDEDNWEQPGPDRWQQIFGQRPFGRPWGGGGQSKVRGQHQRPTLSNPQLGGKRVGNFHNKRDEDSWSLDQATKGSFPYPGRFSNVPPQRLNKFDNFYLSNGEGMGKFGGADNGRNIWNPPAGLGRDILPLNNRFGMSAMGGRQYRPPFIFWNNNYEDLMTFKLEESPIDGFVPFTFGRPDTFGKYFNRPIQLLRLNPFEGFFERPRKFNGQSLLPFFFPEAHQYKSRFNEPDKLAMDTDSSFGNEISQAGQSNSRFKGRNLLKINLERRRGNKFNKPSLSGTGQFEPSRGGLQRWDKGRSANVPFRPLQWHRKFSGRQMSLKPVFGGRDPGTLGRGKPAKRLEPSYIRPKINRQIKINFWRGDKDPFASGKRAERQGWKERPFLDSHYDNQAKKSPFWPTVGGLKVSAFKNSRKLPEPDIRDETPVRWRFPDFDDGEINFPYNNDIRSSNLDPQNDVTKFEDLGDEKDGDWEEEALRDSDDDWEDNLDWNYHDNEDDGEETISTRYNRGYKHMFARPRDTTAASIYYFSQLKKLFQTRE